MKVLSNHRSLEWIRRLSLIEAALATVLADQDKERGGAPAFRAAVWVAHAHAQDTRDELLQLTVAPVAAEIMEQV